MLTTNGTTDSQSNHELQNCIERSNSGDIDYLIAVAGGSKPAFDACAHHNVNQLAKDIQRADAVLSRRMGEDVTAIADRRDSFLGQPYKCKPSPDIAQTYTDLARRFHDGSLLVYHPPLEHMLEVFTNAHTAIRHLLAAHRPSDPLKVALAAIAAPAHHCLELSTAMLHCIQTRYFTMTGTVDAINLLAQQAINTHLRAYVALSAPGGVALETTRWLRGEWGWLPEVLTTTLTTATLCGVLSSPHQSGGIIGTFNDYRTRQLYAEANAVDDLLVKRAQS